MQSTETRHLVIDWPDGAAFSQWEVTIQYPKNERIPNPVRPTVLIRHVLPLPVVLQTTTAAGPGPASTGS